jgi:hypothetical protein
LAFPLKRNQNEIFDVPAIKSTASILHSGLKVSTTQLIFITSSAIAIVITYALSEGGSTNCTQRTPASRCHLAAAAWQNTESAYNASKTLALLALKEERVKESGSFSLGGEHGMMWDDAMKLRGSSVYCWEPGVVAVERIDTSGVSEDRCQEGC